MNRIMRFRPTPALVVLVPALLCVAALAGAAQAASFDAVKFARDAQADLTSARSRKDGIFGGRCTATTKTHVRCVVISPAYAKLVGGKPRFRVEFAYAGGVLVRTAYTADGIRLGQPSRCRYLTYASFSRHCDT